MACCIVLGLPPSVSPLFLWPAVLLWACLPPFLPCFYGLLYCSGLASLCFSPVFMACCIVMGLPPSVSPLFLWPAVLFWACLPLFLPCFYGLLYCPGLTSLCVSVCLCVSLCVSVCLCVSLCV